MRHHLAALFVLLMTVVSIQADERKLVWSDEFDKPGMPDESKWTYEEGFIRNRESQYYTRARQENARVEDGVLVIEARREQYKDPSIDPNRTGGRRRGPESVEYTSASVNTKGKVAWRYGRIEVRAKLPTGRGMWPAIWMLGTNIDEIGWPACGEIDIMENVGFAPDVIHANIHTKAYNHVKGTGKGAKLTVPNPHDDFHIYAVEWTEKTMDFFVDDQKVFTFENEGTGRDVWPYDQPHYLILNIAVGGAWGGQKGIDDEIFPQKMLIDYVRVYSP